LELPVIINHIPDEFVLHQNYPNPFNPQQESNTICQKRNNHTQIYDILGREIYAIDEFKKAGSYSLTFDGSNYSSGIYFIDLNQVVILRLRRWCW
jgi:hypothetical protein